MGYLIYFAFACCTLLQPTNATNKNDNVWAVVTAISEKAEISTDLATSAFGHMSNSLTSTLKKGGRCSLVGFGSFSVSNRAARTKREIDPSHTTLPMREFGNNGNAKQTELTDGRLLELCGPDALTNDKVKVGPKYHHHCGGDEEATLALQLSIANGLFGGAGDEGVRDCTAWCVLNGEGPGHFKFDNKRGCFKYRKTSMCGTAEEKEFAKAEEEGLCGNFDTLDNPKIGDLWIDDNQYVNVEIFHPVDYNEVNIVVEAAVALQPLLQALRGPACMELRNDVEKCKTDSDGVCDDEDLMKKFNNCVEDAEEQQYLDQDLGYDISFKIQVMNAAKDFVSKEGDDEQLVVNLQFSRDQILKYANAATHPDDMEEDTKETTWGGKPFLRNFSPQLFDEETKEPNASAHVHAALLGQIDNFDIIADCGTTKECDNDHEGATGGLQTSVAQATGISAGQAKEAVSVFLNNPPVFEKHGDRVGLIGFGCFSISDRAARHKRKNEKRRETEERQTDRQKRDRGVNPYRRIKIRRKRITYYVIGGPNY